jgi:hypothetical protein
MGLPFSARSGSDRVTKETAQFLLDLLGAQQLNVGASDFDVVVEQVLRARAELADVLVDHAVR